MTAALLLLCTLSAASWAQETGAPPALEGALFEVSPASLRGVSLTVQLRAMADLGALEAALEAVEAGGGRATVIVPAALAEREPERLRAAAGAGHEIALWLKPPPDASRGVEGVNAWKRAARAQLKALRQASGKRPRVVLVPVLPRTGEIALDDLRIRTVLLDRPDHPRRIVDLSGIPGGLVFPSPQVAPVSAAALDSVARALAEAADGGFPTVGLSLSLGDLSPPEAALLRRWMAEVIAPSGVDVLTARRIPQRAAAASTESPSEPAAVARPVDRVDLEAAAAELAGATRVPRALTGGLNPTEAFLGLCLLLAADTPPQRVLLGDLGPPADEARSSLSAGAILGADDVRQAAARIAPYLSHRVPNLIDAGDATLTAAEFLLAMARVVAGDDPVALSTPMNPDPYTTGLGWGDSTGR